MMEGGVLAAFAIGVSGDYLRIARELHDVVAHHVSVMGVQAAAARRVMGKDPDAATAALTSVEQSSRDAVTQMRYRRLQNVKQK